MFVRKVQWSKSFGRRSVGREFVWKSVIWKWVKLDSNLLVCTHCLGGHCKQATESLPRLCESDWTGLDSTWLCRCVRIFRVCCRLLRWRSRKQSSITENKIFLCQHYKLIFFCANTFSGHSKQLSVITYTCHITRHFVRHLAHFFIVVFFRE